MGHLCCSWAPMKEALGPPVPFSKLESLLGHSAERLVEGERRGKQLPVQVISL